MLLSLNWLREFVPYTGNAEELGEKLTMLGLELDDIIRPFAGLEDLVVGHVLECGKHPEADKLSVCKVDVGTEVLDIVCGAPNVAKGQYVVVAPIGSTLPGGLKIKKAKLRGQESCGMICSERELGLSEDHSGIMVLQELVEGPFTPGAKALDALKLDTEILDISVTPNRADCLSVLGLAREAALAFNLPLSMPKLERNGMDSSCTALGQLGLLVEGGDLAPLYELQAIEGVKVGKSPAWLRWRLQACGLRPISNVVDVTNYILLELGQPLHSFDFNKVRGGHVIVALAKEGEKFTTLDGVERSLQSGDITIRDTKGPIALAGVMGGANSEIDENSSTVLLEGAVFNTKSVRLTSRRLDLHSDAAYRFERGVDQALTMYALERASIMIANLAGGRIAQRSLGEEQRPWLCPEIGLRQERAESLIGVCLDAGFCVKTLETLGCQVREAKRPKLRGNSSCGVEERKFWMVTPPSWRRDLEREADLIEELARVYGVDRIEETLPRVRRPLERAGLPEARHKFLTRVKYWAAGLGLNEAVNYSFVGHKDLDLIGYRKEGRISIMNPLSAELDVLRPVLAPGLLNTLRNNVSKGNNAARVFEVAAGFTADAASETGARENMRLGILLYGDRYSSAWPRKPEDFDFLDLKGFVEHFINWLDLPAAEYALDKDPAPWMNPEVRVSVQGEKVGAIGRVKPDVAEEYHARKDVWLAELDLDALEKLHAAQKLKFQPLPVYPPVRRDITVIAPRGLEAESVLKAIHDAKPANLEDVTLVDLFEPRDSGERNLTYRLTFRHADRTLQDTEVDKVRDKVANYLTQNLSVRV